MNLPTEIFDQVIVVHAPEELVTEQAASLEATILGLERRLVVFDLDDTEMLDSRGLTAIVDTLDRLRRESGDMKIAVSNTTNRKILEITRLDQHLEVFESVVDAVKSFQ